MTSSKKEVSIKLGCENQLEFHLSELKGCWNPRRSSSGTIHRLADSQTRSLWAMFLDRQLKEHQGLMGLNWTDRPEGESGRGRGWGSSLQGQKHWKAPLLLCWACLSSSLWAQGVANLNSPLTWLTIHLTLVIAWDPVLPNSCIRSELILVSPPHKQPASAYAVDFSKISQRSGITKQAAVGLDMPCISC